MQVWVRLEEVFSTIGLPKILSPLVICEIQIVTKLATSPKPIQLLQSLQQGSIVCGRGEWSRYAEIRS